MLDSWEMSSWVWGGCMAVEGTLCGILLVLVDVVAILSAIPEEAPLLALEPEVAAVLRVDQRFVGNGWVVFFFFLVYLGMVIYTA